MGRLRQHADTLVLFFRIGYFGIERRDIGGVEHFEQHSFRSRIAVPRQARCRVVADVGIGIIEQRFETVKRRIPPQHSEHKRGARTQFFARAFLGFHFAPFRGCFLQCGDEFLVALHFFRAGGLDEHRDRF